MLINSLLVALCMILDPMFVSVLTGAADWALRDALNVLYPRRGKAIIVSAVGGKRT